MRARVVGHNQATMNGLKEKVLTLDTMNACVKRLEYAVRGPIVQRALELEQELRQVWPWTHHSPPDSTKQPSITRDRSLRE